MTKNYLTYPCKVMSITQSYTGNYSHGPHNTGSPKDYPWDEACGTTARSPMYCPCDEMTIKRLYKTGTNTIWLQSTTKVWFADGTTDYVVLMVTHPNDSDINRLRVGQKFKRGELICYEGTDGNATGNHFHFSAGKGVIKGNGWVQNSRNKWVLSTTKGTFKPEKLFYVDRSFTTVKKTAGITFKNLPKQTTSTANSTIKKAEFFDKKGYFKYGDSHENIGKVAEHMYKHYPAYTKKAALGTYFGKNLLNAVREFRRRTGLTPNNRIDEAFINKLIAISGFKAE